MTTRFGLHRTANPDYTIGHRLLEMFGVAAFFVLESLLGLWCADNVRDPWVALLCAGAVALGYLLADLFSGVVHWAGDTLGDDATPLLGRSFIRPFREHHVDPKDITRHDFLETNGNNCLVSLPVLFAAYALAPEGPAHPGWVFGVATLASCALAVFLTNQFHKWAHADAVHPLVKWLQDRRLILSPEHHQIHHTPPFDVYYCITTGWLNPVLTRLRVLRGVERAISAALGPGAIHR